MTRAISSLCQLNSLKFYSRCEIILANQFKSILLTVPLLITFLLVVVLIASTALVLRLIFASRVLTRFVLHYTLLLCRILKAMAVLVNIAALK